MAAGLGTIHFSCLPAQTTQAQQNGCGPASLGLLSHVIPDGPLRLSRDLFEAAGNHDLCYTLEPRQTQATCDTAFLDTMLAACRYYTVAERRYFDRVAAIYYAAVSSYGKAFYQMGQVFIR